MRPQGQATPDDKAEGQDKARKQRGKGNGGNCLRAVVPSVLIVHARVTLSCW
ncbi:hypothetical protein Geu3261_0017_003 [Komagataeibacter europaeus NBRC 3261]|uniref:Uncharacterized protein n=1 Tax=Komagataeibacter europaeus NBRC 3261 TaxID=1234669 RepID=A0A0D6PVA5_KOMEU|nr:hypothetical protein [Komagataeibacter europaeus]GAN95237.1 hypothetical protein Geu3261_0017_003 [Komagataeibacter europaeus NBRC 3261]